MEGKAEYKMTNREFVGNVVEWKCGCGFLYALIEGYNPDFNSSDFGAVLIPNGICRKCKKEIYVDKSNIPNTRSFRRTNKQQKED